MVAKKRGSKRTTLQQKYKIQKRTKEHHRKLKKGSLDGRRKKKVSGDSIPNAWPFKEDLLKQIKAAQDKMEEYKLRQKEKRKADIASRRAGNKNGAVVEGGADSMEEGQSDDEAESGSGKSKSKNTLSIPASDRSSSFTMDGNHVQSSEAIEDTHGGKDVNLGKNSRRAYLKELRKTIDGADVILQILDARDPLGTRSTAVEEMVTSKANKKFVYVLNKADLVPRDVLAGWLAYLRRTHPAIPFKSNTQQGQTKNLGRTGGKANKQQEGALQTNQAVGTEELIGLLKNYSRVGDTKSVIVVGVVGFPNVGKSSIINSLMRSRAVGVSSMPGFTKVAQEVVLDKNIRLMDSPGIVFADGDSASTTLRNCVNVEELEDVLTPIQAILERCPAGYLMQLYAIPAFNPNDCTTFLALVAKSMGKLKKGGTPNTDAAARIVLHDWNEGKIKYYCKAPVLATTTSLESEGDSMIVNQFSKESDLLGFDVFDSRILDELEANEIQAGNGASYVSMDAVGDDLAAYLDDGDADTVQSKPSKKIGGSKKVGGGNDDDARSVATSGAGSRRAASVSNPYAAASAASAAKVEEPGVDLRKAGNAALKKKKKDQRRGADSTAAGKEQYSFEDHF